MSKLLTPSPLSPARRITGSALTAAALAFILMAAASGAAHAAPIDAGALRANSVTTFRTAEKVTLGANDLQVEARPAIPFTPFPMVDPNTGKPVAPTTVLNLPSGKQATAQVYYSQLNAFEQWLNQHGYSLRTTPKGAQTELAKIPVDEAALQQQLQAAPPATTLPRRPDLAAANLARTLAGGQPVSVSANSEAAFGAPTALTSSQVAGINTKLNAANIQGATLNGLVISPAALAQIAKLNLNVGAIRGPVKSDDCTPLSGSRGWGWSTTSSHFTGYISGSLKLTGQACKPPDMNNFNQNQSKFDITAEGKAGGTVFGEGGDLLRLTGDLSGNQAAGTVTAKFDVFVAGQNIYSLDKTSPTYSDTPAPLDKPVDFSASTTITIGPIPVDLNIGAQGDAGLQYSLSLNPMQVSMSAAPYVKATVYAQAAVDLVIAKAGVGANLTLMNWQMNMHANAGVGWRAHYYAYDGLYADSSIKMLAGNVYAFAEVWYPCVPDVWDTCESKWTDNLFSWNGLQYNSVLFNEQHTINLGW